MSKKKTIYTVSSVDVETDNPIETATIGSFKTLERAASLCAEYMLERIAVRPDIRYAIFHDINHGDVICEISRRSRRPKKYLEKKFSFDMYDEWKMPPAVESALREFLVETLRADAIYSVETESGSDIGAQTYIFEIAKNDLEL